MADRELPYINQGLEEPSFTEGGGDLYELEKRKDILVNLRDLQYYPFPYGDYQTPEAWLKRGQTLLSELSSEYNISVTPTRYIITGSQGTDRSKLGFDIIRKKVEGEELRNVAANIPRGTELASQVSKLTRNLCKYLRDKTKNGEDMLQDIYKPEQYVYGSTNPDEKPALVLVDTDPAFISTRHLDSTNIRQQLEQSIGEMIHFFMHNYNLLSDEDWQPAYEDLVQAARAAKNLLSADPKCEYIEAYVSRIENIFNG